MENISKVYKSKLCCSCGVCRGICPTNAISYSIDNKGFFKPIVDKDKCVDCGQCLKYCPGTQYYTKENNNKCEYIYGYSNNSLLRKNSSSGGIGTEILVYLLSQGYIDYCIVVKNITKIEEAEVEITNDINEVINSSGSKYCPVPIGDIIKTIKNSNKKYAIIGLPCQMSSIKRYFMDTNNDNIVYYISLLCNHLPSYNASKFILHNLNIKKYEKFLYRGGGWPGYFKIFTKKNIYKLPYRKTFAIGFGKYFKNSRCYICNDPFGAYADISLGDAYFLNEAENKDGNTFCIVRNKEVMKIINNMENSNVVTIKKDLSENQINKAFKALYNRVDEIPQKIAVYKSINKPIPDNYNQNLITLPTFRKKLGILRQLLIMDAGRFKFLWKYLFAKNNGKSLDINITKIQENTNDK